MAGIVPEEPPVDFLLKILSFTFLTQPGLVLWKSVYDIDFLHKFLLELVRISCPRWDGGRSSRFFGGEFEPADGKQGAEQCVDGGADGDLTGGMSA